MPSVRPDLLDYNLQRPARETLNTDQTDLHKTIPPGHILLDSRISIQQFLQATTLPETLGTGGDERIFLQVIRTHRQAGHEEDCINRKDTVEVPLQTRRIHPTPRTCERNRTWIRITHHPPHFLQPRMFLFRRWEFLETNRSGTKSLECVTVCRYPVANILCFIIRFPLFAKFYDIEKPIGIRV